MSTFRAFKCQEYVPAKADFHGILGKLGLNQKIIEENLAFEKRNKPGKVKDPNWWLYIKLEWVVVFRFEGRWRSQRSSGSYWDIVSALPPSVREAHVFGSRGNHHRFYRRVFSYFKVEPFSILEFSEQDREELFKILKGGIKQKTELANA